MSKFKASYRGIGELLKSPEMQAHMLVRAEAAKAFAETEAPVFETGPHPGRYKAAFHVESGIQHHKTERAYAELSNDAPEALFVEFGTRNNAAHHTLTRSLDAMRG